MEYFRLDIGVLSIFVAILIQFLIVFDVIVYEKNLLDEAVTTGKPHLYSGVEFTFCSPTVKSLCAYN